MALEKKPGHPLRIWRAANGVTMKAFAAEYGCSRSYLSQFEKGRKRPAYMLMQKVREVTNGEVTADAMMDWYETHTPDTPDRERGET